MGIWRTFVSRPAEVERTELYYGGPVYIAGYTPTGEDSMYAFLVEKAQDRFGTSDEEATRIMLEESRAYDGPWNSIRADLEAGAHANYTWFTPAHRRGAVEPRPRRHHRRRRAQLPSDDRAGRGAGPRGRATCSPSCSSTRMSVDQELWDDFHARRLPRAQGAWSRHPCSSASGRSTATATRMPAA